MGWRKEKTDEKDKHHHTFGEGLQQVGDFFDEDDDDGEVYVQTEEERQEAAEREIERMRMLLERTDTLSACGMQFSEELIAKLVIITLVLNVVAGAILLVTGMISWQRGSPSGTTIRQAHQSFRDCRTAYNMRSLMNKRQGCTAYDILHAGRICLQVL